MATDTGLFWRSSSWSCFSDWGNYMFRLCQLQCGCNEVGIFKTKLAVNHVFSPAKILFPEFPVRKSVKHGFSCQTSFQTISFSCEVSTQTHMVSHSFPGISVPGHPLVAVQIARTAPVAPADQTTWKKKVQIRMNFRWKLFSGWISSWISAENMGKAQLMNWMKFCEVQEMYLFVFGACSLWRGAVHGNPWESMGHWTFIQWSKSEKWGSQLSQPFKTMPYKPYVSIYIYIYSCYIHIIIHIYIYIYTYDGAIWGRCCICLVPILSSVRFDRSDACHVWIFDLHPLHRLG